MSKTQLKTDFVCIATAGATVDGREISAQDLFDMAETYNPETYTAMIWWEHLRFFGNLGQVLSLKAEEVDGKTKLYAELRPTAELVEFNQAGQKVFTSIEIMPNFAKTGKSYLGGLAVTDSPASIGTTQLNFSSKGIKDELVIGNKEPFHFTLAQEETGEGKEGFFAALSNLIKKFSGEMPTDEPPPNNHNNNEEQPMDKEQFSQLLNAVNGLGAKIDEKFSQQPPAAEPPQPQEPGAKDEQVVSVQEFNNLQTKFSELEQKFNTLANTEITPTPKGTGGNDENKFNMAI